MKAQYTPGPWTRHDLDVYANKPPLTVGGNSRTVTVADLHEVEMIRNGDLTYEEQHANARLISEAPSMLALLRDVGAWLECGLSRGQINRGTANRDGDLVTQIRSAIAKAEGRE